VGVPAHRMMSPGSHSSIAWHQGGQHGDRGDRADTYQRPTAQLKQSPSPPIGSLTAGASRDRSRTEVIIHARSWPSPADSYLHILHLALQNSHLGAAAITATSRFRTPGGDQPVSNHLTAAAGSAARTTASRGSALIPDSDHDFETRLVRIAPQSLTAARAAGRDDSLAVGKGGEIGPHGIAAEAGYVRTATRPGQQHGCPILPQHAWRRTAGHVPVAA